MRTRTQDRRRGAAAVELAVLLPFIVFVAVIGTDWARLMYYTITVEACARNGVMYASDEVVRQQSPYSDVADAAMAEAPNLSTGTRTKTKTTVGTTTTTTYSEGSPPAVVATVVQESTTDATGAAAVKVTVTVPFKTITNFPGVPSSETLTRSVQMRVAALAIK